MGGGKTRGKGNGKASGKAAGRPGGKAGGDAGGKGGGSWVWVPESGSKTTVVANVQKAIQFQKKLPLGGKGKGKGVQGGKGSNKGGKGDKGKGGKASISKWGEKLKTIDPSLKVWIGGLSESTTWKELEGHFMASGVKPVVTEIMKKGQAVLAYKTIEDVETAISTFNGTDVGGKTIEVDVWVKTAKPERPNRKGPGAPKASAKKLSKAQALAKKAVKPVQKAALKLKNQKAKGDDKIREKLKAFDSTQKVWIGGLAEETTWKELSEHLSAVSKPKVTHIMSKGTAVAAFDSADDAASVIGTFSDTSELGGKTIQVDVWTKAEKTERKPRMRLRRGSRTRGGKARTVKLESDAAVKEEV
eukprot:TRINITY_DN4074_c1_g6_i1.p1 TRINITY_DN4074_c1_g6~~TRINITY_DN4074_c1_g6_i1.p1  ORF type:complete len:359 (-),score=97.60 TRINITY_DN4074_c1_g6_i1:575-1651(-)